MAFLGLDTSNYTTSAALWYPDENRVVQQKKLLPVKQGEKGLRQSDAVFHHTQQLPQVIEALFEGNTSGIDGIGVSLTPTTAKGSYMPCFSVGASTARVLGTVFSKKVSFFSHQQGHIAAALYSANRLDLLSQKFIAFHVSGGTTEAVLVEPDKNELFTCTPVAKSLDLKAGQAIDRVGVMLGLSFPCGAELDKLSRNAEPVKTKIKPSMKGTDCSLSGVENKCKMMFDKGESPENIALFCIEFIASALEGMITELSAQHPNLQLVFSGGVMSNSIISQRFAEKYGALFATPAFSADNAAGIAVLASMR